MPAQSNVVLVVEDEPLIAMAIEAVIEQAGLTPHTSRTLVDALQIGQQCDLRGAVLDYWIGEADTTELADALKARGIPFILTSGTDPQLAGGPFSDIPILRKPYSDADLLMHLKSFGVGK